MSPLREVRDPSKAAGATACDGRRRICLAAAGALALTGCGHFRRRDLERRPGRLIPFSEASVAGGLPTAWQPQVPRPDLPRTLYEIVERDDRRVLHAVADRSASGLRCAVDIDPLATPWLEWEWRARTVDPRATVSVDARDDSPARLAVGFDGELSRLGFADLVFGELVLAITGYSVPYATLMYVWDGEAPVGSVLTHARTSRIRYLVVESGASRADRWVGYRRNVVEDYRRVFGGDPGRIQDVGVVTDSDDLNTWAETWYGDLAFRAG